MALVLKATHQEVSRTPPVAPPHPRLDEAALAAFGCDVSFVSDDSTPPEEIVTRAAERAASHDIKHLLWDIFERLRAEYQADAPLFHPAAVAARVRQAAATFGLSLNAEHRAAFQRFFDDVNQILFQHQTLAWLLNGDNFKVQLYGKGWEAHPAFARHARGVVRDETMRQTIVRASKINLAAGAYGAVTPRLIDGMTQGGFFLMRYAAADVIDKLYPPLIDFCAGEHLHTNAALDDRATPGVRALLSFASRTLGVDVLRDWPEFVPHLLSLRQQARSRSAVVLWPEHYQSVCFSSRDELLNLAEKFLYDQPQRRQLADAMRRQWLKPAPPRVSLQVNRSVIAAPRRLGEVAA